MDTRPSRSDAGAIPALVDVLEEHLEELDFLIEQREGSLFEIDLFPFHLSRLEDRIEAHLDGLREGHDASRTLARAALAADSWSLVAAAGLVLLQPPTADVEAVAERLALAECPEPADEDDRAPALGLAFAMRYSAPSSWNPLLIRFAGASSVVAAALLADALAFHRLALPGALLQRIAAAEAGSIRALWWGVRRRVGPAPSLRELEAELASGTPALRRAALLAAARWATPGLLEQLRSSAARGEAADAEAILMLGALGDPSDRGLLEAALARPAVAAPALRALGALGERKVLPRLIEAMDDERLGAAAADAFLAITGEAVAGVEDPPDPDLEAPDADEARELLSRFEKQEIPDGRLRSGRLVDELSLESALEVLDLEGALHAWLRACAQAPEDAPDLELEAFASRRASPHGKSQTFSG